MTARNLDQYGDGLFDILWKGALQPIIDDFNNSDDEKQESKISNISSESPTSTSKHCNPTRSRPTTEVSLPSQYSPSSQ
ncbi:hypothetical protein EB796_014576 [Bugula neritina]|uniref:Uncharacterized protein n=1 Tax=Bugula neritina TaxID=10212 RepID=A0A7J7JLH7_BUGNE|nr:hypothetical protein EB796_014576 [Bugula neritina]